jgi:hypothetical protein
MLRGSQALAPQDDGMEQGLRSSLPGLTRQSIETKRRAKARRFVSTELQLARISKG